MKHIQKKAYAKINVILNVLGKTDNNMHLVDMVMTPLALHDVLDFQEISGPEIVIHSDVYIGELEDNLVYKAARALQHIFACDKGVEITIQKNIPMSAGLAGGSSDCAATLLALNELWNVHATKQELETIAKELGSDVPYCLYHQTMRVRGIGEKLEQIAPFPHFHVSLIKPAYGISTKEAYESLVDDYTLPRGKVGKMVKSIEEQDKKAILHHVANSFETTTFEKHEDLYAIKVMAESVTPGTLLSGSGPTIFILYEDIEMQHIFQKLVKNRNVTFIQTETI